MSNHFASILAIDLTKWWRHLPFSERLFLVFVALIASFALPLSILNIGRPTSLTPKAADYPTYSRNKSPAISTQKISCEENKPCSVFIKASDPDITDELRMEVDFLPTGLALTNCTHSSTLFADLGITCTLEGTATHKAKYSLLATVFDHEAKSASAIINLEIR